MKRRVVITGPAKRDAFANHEWWAENRSAEQAIRWLKGIYAKMWSLADTAERHSRATEPSLRRNDIRQASFGLSSKPTHRILYRIEREVVVVYRVQAFAQDAIDWDDLTDD
ncbi:MAG: type II toxin-antitoxin system RelE/ParE family toxin [Planctomycetota bacterium]